MWKSLRTNPKLINGKKYKIRMVIAIVNDKDLYEEFNAIYYNHFKIFIDEEFNLYNIDDIDDVFIEGEPNGNI